MFLTILRCQGRSLAGSLPAASPYHFAARTTTAALNAQRSSIFQQKLFMSSTTASKKKEEDGDKPPAEEDSVLFEVLDGGIGVYSLNRPKTLNALNLDMISKMHHQIKKWEQHPYITMIIGRGNGGKAFCAGGDVRAIAEAGKKNDPLAFDFFRDEYVVDHLLGVSRKPVVSILDGITMGGGVGISVHGHFRVATEKTVFAMPETGIGLFPDVGGSFFLPRLDGSLGMFLALTGYRLKGCDVMMAGIATHYIPSKYVEDAIQRLQSLTNNTSTLYAHKQKDSIDYIVDPLVVSNALDEMAGDITPFSLAPHRPIIDKCFSKKSVEEIFAALDNEATNDDNQFAKETLATLQRMSPSSLKITFEQIRRGASMTFKQCLEMELAMTQEVMKRKDFYEGIRAVLIDKDQKPIWQPPTLSGVTEQDVAAHFPKTTPKIPFVSDRDYLQYPHGSLGLPSEKEIRAAVNLVPMNLEQLILHLAGPNQKAGLREKVTEVVGRLCTVDNNNGTIRWGVCSGANL